MTYKLRRRYVRVQFPCYDGSTSSAGNQTFLVGWVDGHPDDLSVSVVVQVTNKVAGLDTEQSNLVIAHNVDDSESEDPG